MSKVTVFSSVSALILSGALASAAVGQTAAPMVRLSPPQTIPAAQSNRPIGLDEPFG